MAQKATLTAFLKLNEEDEDAHQYLYCEIPEHFTFTRQKTCKRRQRIRNPVIGRIYQVHPSHPERFALRLLLLHRKGVTSFEDLRTIDGYLHETFKDAARAMGLLEDDTEHRRCLQEASIMNMPSQMRQLFATLLVFQPHLTSEACLTNSRKPGAKTASGMCSVYVVLLTMVDIHQG